MCLHKPESLLFLESLFSVRHARKLIEKWSFYGWSIPLSSYTAFKCYLKQGSYWFANGSNACWQRIEHTLFGVCLNKDRLTDDKCYVWLVTANEQSWELKLNGKMFRQEDASGRKLYVPLLSAPLLLFTTRQATQCGRCEARKAIIFNWGRESHH